MSYRFRFVQPIGSWLVLKLPSSPLAFSFHSRNYATVIEAQKLLRFRVPKTRVVSHGMSSFRFTSPGSKLLTASIIGISTAYGLVNFMPSIAYARTFDGRIVNRKYADSRSASSNEEERRAFWSLVRKIWLPTAFLITIMFNFDYPLMLVLKVVLGLMSTKPSPLSVYLYVDQLCQQRMLREPYLYVSKSLCANRVEVLDYKVLCIARVDLHDEQYTLVGILGSWWAIPSSLIQPLFYQETCRKLTGRMQRHLAQR